MPHKPFPIVRLLLASTLVLASSCASKPEHLALTYPQAADLAVEPAPIAKPEIATSEEAYETYNDDVAGWGKRGWAAVARQCRFWQRLGMPVTCPAEPAH